jgi:hypothetical protein
MAPHWSAARRRPFADRSSWLAQLTGHQILYNVSRPFVDAGSYPFDTIHCDRANKPRRADYFFLVNRVLTHAVCVIAKRAQFETEQTYDKGKAGAAYVVSAVQKNSGGILWISLDRPLHLVPP